MALIPPVSGGSFRLIDGPSTSRPCCARSRIAEAGAVASFVGTVRSQSRGRDVLHLDYEAFEEMAEPMLAVSATS